MIERMQPQCETVSSQTSLNRKPSNSAIMGGCGYDFCFADPDG